ncbi:hypothetical protein TL16_g13080 [Triparma laevis f. inornata]|uniref:Uncharacterized protein n=1 Tax=Triparma laevis f. inornata TaxID=1714386 RepID=A0A9W7BR74_9STRA|nr:hypothetical protein TL16_g13080 [Triparma laevis f. inornata]
MALSSPPTFKRNPLPTYSTRSPLSNTVFKALHPDSSPPKSPRSEVQQLTKPQHNTREQPHNFYQLDQVEMLPETGDGSSSVDFEEMEARVNFEEEMGGRKWDYTSGVFVLPKPEKEDINPFKASCEFKKTSTLNINPPNSEPNDAELVTSLQVDVSDSDSDDEDNMIYKIAEPTISKAAPPRNNLHSNFRQPSVPSVPKIPTPGPRFGKNLSSKISPKISSTRSDPGRKISSTSPTSPRILKLAGDFKFEIGSLTNRTCGGAISQAQTEAQTESQTETDAQTDCINTSYDSPPPKSITSTITFTTTRSQLNLLTTLTNPPPISPIKPPKPKRTTPYNNYHKFMKMQEENKGKDWMVCNDGTPYVSKFKVQLRKDRGDPEKMMCGGSGFRLYAGKRSKWKLPTSHSVRNSGPYLGHHSEANLIEGRGIKDTLKDRWVGERWGVIGCRRKPEVRRKVARGFHGVHGDLHEGVTKI